MAVDAPLRLKRDIHLKRPTNRLAELQGPFRMAAQRVRTERALSLAVKTLTFPIFLTIAWVLLVRFTLVDLPQWPALVPVLCWGVALLVIRARTRVSTGQAARYLDHALALDEAIATYVEIVSQRVRDRRSPGSRSRAQALGDNIQHTLKTRGTRLPGANVRVTRKQLVVIAGATLVLGLALSVPTPFDAIRLEKEKLAQSISSQLQRIADLRADFISRPQVPDATRSALLTELDRLEASLKTPGVDQASVLAAISDTQERLRQISPDLSSDYDPIIRAAQKIQETILRNSTWAGGSSSARTDIGRAADATEFFSNYIINRSESEAFGPGFTKASQSSSALGFESASSLVAVRDAALARLLQDTSAALRDKTLAPAAQLLTTLGTELRSREGRQQAAEAVEHALSSLDDGKQSIAQSTDAKQRKTQVGFRRGQTADALQTTTAVANGSSKPPSGATPGSESASKTGDGNQTDPLNPASATHTSNNANPGLGPNMPGGSNPGSIQGQQPDKPGSSSGQPGDGTNGGTQKSGQAGGQPSTLGGTPQAGQSDGKLSGPVTGPGGGVSGGITKVENPEGVGISQGDASNSTQSNTQQDTVSLPVDASGTGGDPDATPAPGAQQGADSGAVGTGGSGDKSDQRGGGTTTTIRTPFTEVIGQYARRAAAALERAYIPQDAKEYVREYFTELGK